MNQTCIHLLKLSTGKAHVIEIANITPISLMGRFDTIQEKLELRYICTTNDEPDVVSISANGLCVKSTASKPNCMCDNIDVTDDCDRKNYQLSLFSCFDFAKVYNQEPQISFGKHKKLDVYRVVSDADIEEYLPVLFRASCHVNEYVSNLTSHDIKTELTTPFIKATDSPIQMKHIFFKLMRSLTVPVMRFSSVSLCSTDMYRNYMTLYLNVYKWVLNFFVYQSPQDELVLFEGGFRFFHRVRYRTYV